MRLKIGLLGPVEVTDDEDCLLALGAGRLRAVLAVLAIHANELVPTERLIDAVWGADASDTAVNNAQVYVGRLRRLLGRERGRLHTQHPGYRLELTDDQ